MNVVERMGCRLLIWSLHNPHPITKTLGVELGPNSISLYSLRVKHIYNLGLPNVGLMLCCPRSRCPTQACHEVLQYPTFVEGMGCCLLIWPRTILTSLANFLGSSSQMIILFTQKFYFLNKFISSRKLTPNIIY